MWTSAQNTHTHTQKKKKSAQNNPASSTNELIFDNPNTIWCTTFSYSLYKNIF